MYSNKTDWSDNRLIKLKNTVTRYSTDMVTTLQIVILFSLNYYKYTTKKISSSFSWFAPVDQANNCLVFEDK